MQSQTWPKIRFNSNKETTSGSLGKFLSKSPLLRNRTHKHTSLSLCHHVKCNTKPLCQHSRSWHSWTNTLSSHFSDATLENVLEQSILFIGQWKVWEWFKYPSPSVSDWRINIIDGSWCWSTIWHQTGLSDDWKIFRFYLNHCSTPTARG